MPDFTTKQREKLAEENEAMPDGSYPIRNRADLKRAIQAFGRSKNPEKTKAWIKKRARELDAEELIPESWKEAQHSDNSEYLIHYGVMGMKWGVRRAQAKANKYNKKLKRGSLHTILALANAGSGLKNVAKYHLDAADRKEVKWKSKAKSYSKKAKELKAKSKQTISRKEYSSTVKKNKQILRENQQKFMLSYGNKKVMKIIQKENKTAVKAINEARVKRGKKKVNKILHNLPGTLV